MIGADTRVAYSRAFLTSLGALDTPMAAACGKVISVSGELAYVQWDRRKGPDKPQMVSVSQLEALTD